MGGVDGVRFRAFDGSTAGPPDASTGIDIRSPRALSYVATAPGDLGLARAYVTGELEVEGDLYGALVQLARLDLQVPLGTRLRLLRELGGFRLLRPPPRPEQEVRLRGRLHSKKRDQQAISHHYDVSNRFYNWILGPSMAYTCAVYQRDTATLEQAQFAKHDLVARKLGLRPGMRLLDVGCGWGGMVMHAAREYGVRALGVTLSRQQAEWAQKAIAEAGLGALGRGGRRGGPGQGAGLAAVPGRRPARLRAQPDPAPPGAVRQARRRTQLRYGAAPGLGTAAALTST